jgi:site-specific recombinase XerD
MSQTIEDTIRGYCTAQHDLNPKTVDEHRYRLGTFQSWAESEGIETVDALQRHHAETYKSYLVTEKDWALTTVKNALYTLRKYYQWLETTGHVKPTVGIGESVIVPELKKSDEARDTMIPHDEMVRIIEYLANYKFASRTHIVVHILYHTGLRRSGLMALDVDDWNPDERTLTVEHRPHSGTSIKGGSDASRVIGVTNDQLAHALDAWVTEQRPAVTDEYDRAPLIATSHGRMHYKSVSKLVYRATRPCKYGVECPWDRDEQECEATSSGGETKCPGSVSAHPLRRSAITNHLRQDVDKDIVSDRMSVSLRTLETHYDARTEKQKEESRRGHLKGRDL